MIKEDKVLVKINLRNSTHYKQYGYDISQKELLVNVDELTKNSKSRVTAICEICESENSVTYGKYNINKNRNNKGYYSCFKCKNLEKEKTCLEKYGVKSYSMTTDFKELDRTNWNIKEGYIKGREKIIAKYGVDSYFKTKESREYNKKWMSSDEFKEKSKIKLIEVYGVDSYSKTDNFKNDLNDKKDIIIEKIRQTFLERYNVLNPSQLESTKVKKLLKKSEIDELRKETCLDKYGVDNVSKDKYIYDKITKTKELNGVIIPKELLSDWEIYKRKVRSVTNSNKKHLYENWDGNDYYDNELIKGYLSHNHTHRFYPTIDHKISVYFGFINNISPEEIGSLENLCITKRFINSMKGKLVEENFNL
jgi:hypothetical protein